MGPPRVTALWKLKREVSQQFLNSSALQLRMERKLAQATVGAVIHVKKTHPPYDRSGAEKILQIKSHGDLGIKEQPAIVENSKKK